MSIAISASFRFRKTRRGAGSPVGLWRASRGVALGAMVWLVGAASSSAQDRAAPDCLLTYADGQLCGRTSIHEAFKCVAFLRGKDVLSTGADTCVASKDRRETCRLRSFRADACSWTR